MPLPFCGIRKFRDAGRHPVVRGSVLLAESDAQGRAKDVHQDGFTAAAGGPAPQLLEPESTERDTVG